MVNTIVFHAESDAAAALQVATILGARHAPLTYAVTPANADATAQLRMGVNMMGLGLIGPHSSIEEMRRILTPVLGVPRRALLVMPGASPPPEIADAGAPLVKLEGDHAADAALLDNIERYASSSGQRSGLRRPAVALAYSRYADNASAPDEAKASPRKPFPIVTALLCVAAALSLAFFAWRTYDLQRQLDARPPPPFPARPTAPLATSAAPPAQATPPLEIEQPAEEVPARTPEPQAPRPEPTQLAPAEATPAAPRPESDPSDGELRGRERQGPDR